MTDIDDVLGLAAQEVPELPSDNEMEELSNLVQQLVEIRERIENGEQHLKDLKKIEVKLSQESVPSKMDEIGFTSVTIPNGRKIAYNPFYGGKIKPESEDLAFDWIEENGHGGVIKGALSVEYRRPQRDEAIALKAALKEQGWDSTIKLSVHHSTFRALAKEVIEEGGVFPPDLFDIFMGRKTTIK